MLKRMLSLVVIFLLVPLSVMANIKKVAVVDVQKVVNKSAQVQMLKKEQLNKRNELAQFIKKSGEAIKKESDPAKKKVLMQKLDKELSAKAEANEKAYKIKLEAADKNITNTIIQQAKVLGYDLVLTKGVVLYGGDDITDIIIKVVK